MAPKQAEKISILVHVGNGRKEIGIQKIKKQFFPKTGPTL